MEIYEDLIDKDEDILWIKKFPPENIIPKRKNIIRKRISNLIRGISFLGVVVIVNILIISIFFMLYSNKRYNSEFGIVLIIILIIINVMCILVIFIVIRDYKHPGEIELSIFREYLKYYKEEDLRNHPIYYIITNKKILLNDRYIMEARGDISEIDNVIELKKDFLVMNLNYLTKVLIKKYSRKIYTIYFRFNSRFKNKLKGETEEATSFIDLSQEEYSEILKILFNLVPNLIVET